VEKNENKDMLPMFVIYLQQHVHIQKEKKKGVLVKSTAQPKPKFSLSKCVASWTQSNYTITRASFHWLVVTLKSTPTKTFYYICFI
jgi:hypothetical protein